MKVIKIIYQKKFCQQSATTPQCIVCLVFLLLTNINFFSCTYLYPAVFFNFMTATSNLSGCVRRNLNFGWMNFCITVCFSAGSGSKTNPESWVSSSPRYTTISRSFALEIQCPAVTINLLDTSAPPHWNSVKI